MASNGVQVNTTNLVGVKQVNVSTSLPVCQGEKCVPVYHADGVKWGTSEHYQCDGGVKQEKSLYPFTTDGVNVSTSLPVAWGKTGGGGEEAGAIRTSLPF